MTRKEAQVFWVVGLIVVVIVAVVVFLPAGSSAGSSDKAAKDTGESPDSSDILVVETDAEPVIASPASATSSPERVETARVPESTPPATATIPTFDATAAAELAEAKTADEIERADNLAISKPPQPVAPVAVPSGATAGSVEVTVGKSHTVGSGDSLARIARRYYGSEAPANIERIVTANPTVLTKGTKSVLMPGMKLAIPDLGVEAAVSSAQPAVAEASSAPAAAAASEPTVQLEAEKIHVVAKGETLAKIASRYLGSSSPDTIKKIMQANPQLKSANAISIGQKIKIPAK
ncbi:MAG TPA: LysM domain-containing protein [Candidatus Brocadiia bacterium]|nr:LysM domain-containing protein [Candidatus Brocadiia bacterium]